MQPKNKKPAFFLSLLLALAAMLLTPSRTARAHTRVDVGPYAIVVGWVIEPVMVGERNAVLFEITKDEVPVEGLEGTLEVQILYAGHTYWGDLKPSETPGLYTADVLPTVRGQYEVLLTGKIEDMEIDEIIQPEEVKSAAILAFPEIPPEPRELQLEIEALQTQLKTANILAIVGIVTGMVGTGLALFALRRPRQ